MKTLFRMGLFSLIALLGCACTQQLLVRSSDFMSPRVSDEFLSGRIGMGVESPTGIDLFEDSDADFPHIDPRLTRSVPTLIGYLNGSLVVLPRFEVYGLDQSIGGKWQFLSFGENKEWAAAIKAGVGQFEQDNLLSADKGRSAIYNVKHQELGLSLGYEFTNQTEFYTSLVEHRFGVGSDSGGTVSKHYNDSGVHRNLALGVQFKMPSSFLWMKEFQSSAEIVSQSIKWNGMKSSTGKVSIGYLLSFAW